MSQNPILQTLHDEVEVIARLGDRPQWFFRLSEDEREYMAEILEEYRAGNLASFSRSHIWRTCRRYVKQMPCRTVFSEWLGGCNNAEKAEPGS